MTVQFDSKSPMCFFNLKNTIKVFYEEIISVLTCKTSMSEFAEKGKISAPKTLEYSQSWIHLLGQII